MFNIGIVILATNAYFVLGIRFIKKFIHYYKGNSKIIFYFFSDECPNPYFYDIINIRYYYDKHDNWRDGTNSKFKNIIQIKNDLQKEVNYVYYFDADTDINKSFTDEWFLGDLVGGEHYGNRSFLKNGSGFDRNPLSKAYVPLNSSFPYTYYYGAFFGGKTEKVISFCEVLRYNQLEDNKIKYEPGVNDESYINQYFHFNRPTLTVKCEDFMFDISDKGGLGETRNVALDIQPYKNMLLKNKDRIFNIKNGEILWL
jgi:hypothetical protein